MARPEAPRARLHVHPGLLPRYAGASPDPCRFFDGTAESTIYRMAVGIAQIDGDLGTDGGSLLYEHLPRPAAERIVDVLRRRCDGPRESWDGGVSASRHRWREAGTPAWALAHNVGMHFIVSPLAVVGLVWCAREWALRLALVGQLMLFAAPSLGGLQAGAWAVSSAILLCFGWCFWSVAAWRNVCYVDAI